MRHAVSLALLMFALVSPAVAEPDFADAVDRTVKQVIIPSYATLAEAATEQISSIEMLCAAPDDASLDQARSDFEVLVLSWSRVELYRFGPAREANRFEKLFYWPDRKGRGLRQVQTILSANDASAETPETLMGKSVAVQGLPALEFVLFGSGSDQLLVGGAFRCTYGAALAHVISRHANALLDGWQATDGFGAVIRQAGSTGSLYQSEAEVVQELLRAASEQLQVVRDLKIAATIGRNPAKAKPKRAPFWRSGLTLNSMLANLDGVELLMTDGLNSLLPAADARHADGLVFEMAQARNVLADLASNETSWLDTASSNVGHQRLSYAMIPLAGAIRVIAESYPSALGLSLGFNSLDGD